MQKVILGLLFLSTTLFSLDWVNGLEAAFKQAKQEKKTVMVLVESNSCGWCKKMKERTLSEDDIQARLNGFVVVKVMSSNPQARAILPQLRGVPSIFFMNEDKTLLASVIGYRNVRGFNAELDKLVAVKNHTNSK